VFDSLMDYTSVLEVIERGMNFPTLSSKLLASAWRRYLVQLFLKEVKLLFLTLSDFPRSEFVIGIYIFLDPFELHNILGTDNMVRYHHLVVLRDASSICIQLTFGYRINILTILPW
jgi:hypothetical protein